MKKKLDTSIIQNELRSGSVFFAPPSPAPETEPVSASPALPEPEPTKQIDRTIEPSSDRSKTKPAETTTERKSERTEIRSEKRSVTIQTKRLTRRYSFEFFDDQITKLKKLKHEAEMRGERLTLSDIARQALDDYLKDD
jgi:hypothetical protein